MLDFVFVWSREGVARWRSLQDEIETTGASLRLAETQRFDAWYSPDDEAAIFTWASDVFPFAADDRVAAREGGLEFFQGWVLPTLGAAPARSISDLEGRIQPSDDLYGEYAIGRAEPGGAVTVWRDLMSSVQLYAREDADSFVLATRASLAHFGATFSTQPVVDEAFARSVLSSAVCLNGASLFKCVECLRQDTVVLRRPGYGRPVVVRRRPDPFFREDLAVRYRVDRARYWDEVYERLIGLVSVLDLAEEPVDLPLSGGKDSRLLLALILGAGKADKLGTIWTRGPEVSPEVRSAAAVLEHLGMRHETRVPPEHAPGTGPARFNIRDRLFRHLFVTEGEISPMDLFWQLRPTRVVQLHGQEAGLRNIAGRRALATEEELLGWFRTHLGNFDFCGILRPEARDANEEEVLAYLSEHLLVLDDHRQLPTKHRIEHRFRRWVARTWQAYNATSFAPYLFANAAVVLATYNAGAESRSLEEFHFEMLSRVDRRLVEIPFANQSWDPGLGALTGREVPSPEPYRWPEDYTVFDQRPSFLALRGHLAELVRAVAEEPSPALSATVDLDRLRAWDPANMQSGHVQPLWQLVNLLVADRVTDFSRLNVQAVELDGLTLPDFDAPGGEAA